MLWPGPPLLPSSRVNSYEAIYRPLADDRVVCVLEPDGNYEGLFRNDNGQSDPNITSLFDLSSLLDNTYGRLPNDRPHQFKFNGTYQTSFNLVLSGTSTYSLVFLSTLLYPTRYMAITKDSRVQPRNGGQSAYRIERTPTNLPIDMGAYYPFKMGERRSSALCLTGST
jgi:hypothetical protein